ncbi:unnamed protein product [Closterium sp. NIES-54]
MSACTTQVSSISFARSGYWSDNRCAASNHVGKSSRNVASCLPSRAADVRKAGSRNGRARPVRCVSEPVVEARSADDVLASQPSFLRHIANHRHFSPSPPSSPSSSHSASPPSSHTLFRSALLHRLTPFPLELQRLQQLGLQQLGLQQLGLQQLGLQQLGLQQLGLQQLGLQQLGLQQLGLQQHHSPVSLGPFPSPPSGHPPAIRSFSSSLPASPFFSPQGTPLPFTRRVIETVQVNIGLYCNQSCQPSSCLFPFLLPSLPLPVPPLVPLPQGTPLPFTRRVVETVQVNIGLYCNQACQHCHVDSSPLRTEMMDHKTAERVVRTPNPASSETLSLTPKPQTLSPLLKPVLQPGVPALPRGLLASAD